MYTHMFLGILLPSDCKNLSSEPRVPSFKQPVFYETAQLKGSKHWNDMEKGTWNMNFCWDSGKNNGTHQILSELGKEKKI